MGSGRGDRNQDLIVYVEAHKLKLQWGPVVVTGIRHRYETDEERRSTASMGSGRGDRNQPRWCAFDLKATALQ